jgi:hypothetical protein
MSPKWKKRVVMMAVVSALALGGLIGAGLLDEKKHGPLRPYN